MTFMSSLKMGRTQRKGILSVGCNPLATSTDPSELEYAVDMGNRATRREAKRNLRKRKKQGGNHVR
jgi:hypothetical protein